MIIFTFCKEQKIHLLFHTFVWVLLLYFVL